jgi:hypothetical protein
VAAALLQAPVTVQAPKLHLAETVPLNPVEQAGAHVDPLGVLTPQVPLPAFGTTGGRGHGAGEQLPVTAQLPEVHVAEMVPVNPWRQAGAHVDPLEVYTAQLP